jgi:predicted GNAT family N-acyltransferase
MVRTSEVLNEEQLKEAQAIRFEVFVEEQKVPAEIEIDEYEDVAAHVLAYDESGRAMATGRIRPYADGKTGKLERIAVRKEARTGGFGRAVMAKLEEIGRAKGYETFVLEAQVHAIGFYEKLGYVNVSKEPFWDAGILHVRMEKEA